jgi:hypothetical protein
VNDAISDPATIKPIGRRFPDDDGSAGMGHSGSSFRTKAYCVQTLSKVNGHLVKKFTSTRDGRENQKMDDLGNARHIRTPFVLVTSFSMALQRMCDCCLTFEQEARTGATRKISKTKYRNQFRRTNYVDSRTPDFLR